MEQHGKKWSKEDEQLILKYLEENQSIYEISKQLKRSQGSIHSRIGLLAYELHREGVSNEEIIVKTKLNTFQLKDFLKEHEEKYIEKMKKKQEKQLEKEKQLEEKIKLEEKMKSEKENQLEEKLKKPYEVPVFSPSQQLAWDKYIKGENVFISGPGGNGKSYFIQKIYEHSQRNNIEMSVTAMTGCAALLLDCKAKTIHSWGNIGLGNEEPDKIVERITKYRKKLVWLKTNVLVIDEVSMLSDELFELLNKVAQMIRKNNAPFGNIQLIFSGDFHQLPPIQKKFCFESPLWNEVFPNQIMFKQNFRQKDDTTYQTILSEIREGCISEKSKEELKKCIQKENQSNLTPTLLYPVKYLSDNVNEEENNKLSGESYTYKMDFNKKPHHKKIEEELNKQRKSILSEEQVTLKIGSQVMCTINLDQENGIINGSQGKVIDFNDKKEPIVKFEYKQIIIPISKHTWYNEQFDDYGLCQIPLILSWAITIHKSQGITLEHAKINIGSNIFEYGQSYVALSRVKSLNGLYLNNIDFSKIKCNPKVIKYYNSI